METEVFKEQVYKPFNDAWKILKMIQYAGQSSDDQEKWNMFIREIDRFAAEYKDNYFAKETLVRMLMDAGNDIAKMNNRGTK